MASNDSYHSVATECTGEYEEKKSRFIARLAPAGTEEAATAFIANVRAENPMARHNVYAYVLRAGNRVRYSDDGEPQKTAGMPVLSVIQHADLFDVVCVVTRYFGGTLLGTGGLVRAYTTATKRALDAASLVAYALCRDIQVVVEYPDFEPLSRWIAERGIVVTDTDYTDVVTLTIRVRAEQATETQAAIEDFCQGRALVEAGAEDFMTLPERSWLYG